MDFHSIDLIINLFDGYRKQVVIARQELLLIEVKGNRYILQAACPHLHWPLMSGAIEGDAIYCPKHGYAFSLLTGKPVNAVASRCNPLKIYPVAYEGNKVGVEI